MKVRFPACALLALLALLCLPGQSGAREVVSLKLLHSQSTYPQGGSYPLALEITIEKGFHVNAFQVNDPSMLPSRLSFQAPAGLSMGKLKYPRPHMVKLSFMEKAEPVYDGTIRVKAMLTVSAGLAPGKHIVKATLFYQACNNQMCFMPQEKELEIKLVVAAKESAVTPLNPEVFGGGQ